MGQSLAEVDGGILKGKVIKVSVIIFQFTLKSSKESEGLILDNTWLS